MTQERSHKSLPLTLRWTLAWCGNTALDSLPCGMHWALPQCKHYYSLLYANTYLIKMWMLIPRHLFK
ncbi:hypothetical protein E2C01_089083 [Portunus trituberculatus]|uniref:Uncharacterized protein n=1 Tax=Portunus trituberculatus TaxID=210409 RepID=A0A5B7JH52_PORTR|nr:hypothetical protein [Portunus trituberculatus]